MNNLFSYDDPLEDSMEQEEMRAEMSEMYQGDDDQEPVTEKELNGIINKMKIGKAAGWDRIEVEVVKRAWVMNPKVFIDLYNGCWKFKVFPDEWKKALVVTLMKSEDKEKSDPSSYRPICLLPILGKILEGVILWRIKQKCETQILRSQYGFMTAKSTEDALHRFMEIQKTQKGKYILGIFLDISNAFNNLWWPAIIKALKKMRCSSQLIEIVKDYLSKRLVIFRTESGSVSRHVNKGCPQGSLLGPVLWNIVFNELLEEFEKAGIKIVAFADDVVIVVEGNTRNQIETIGQKAVEIAEKWCQKFKMKLSEKKTVMMLCKGKLDIKRPPTVKLAGNQISMVEEFKYLGVTFQHAVKGIKAGRHVEAVSSKSKVMFSALKRVAKRDWGLGFKALKIIYKGLFLAMTMYAVSVWRNMVNVRDWQKLNSAQRQALIGIASAYRTVSLDAIQVIVGEYPIDLEARRRSAEYALRRSETITYGETVFHAEMNDRSGRSRIRRTIKEILLDEWQDRWTRSSKGRETFEFLPDVRDRMRMTWFEPNFYVTQIITGHGDFAEKLTNLEIKDDPTCKCGEIDNSKHLLYDCILFDKERSNFVNKCIDKGIEWPAQRTKLLGKEIIKDLKDFATTTLKEKETWL